MAAKNKKLEKAFVMCSEDVNDLLKENKADLERTWKNREEDEAMVVDFKIKLLPKDKDNIKVETHITFAPEKKVKAHKEHVVTDQTTIPGMKD